MYTFSPLYKGKVPYVPSTQKVLRKAWKLLNIQSGDRVVDLGSGSGQFLCYGARRVDAHFTGIEMNSFLIAISRLNAFLTRKKGTIILKKKNYYDEDLSRYNKVYLFNMPSELKHLVPKLEKELPQNIQIVSAVFPIESKKFSLVNKDVKKSGEKNPVFLYERVRV